MTLIEQYQDDFLTETGFKKKKTRIQSEAAKRYRAHARLKKKGYKVDGRQRTVYSVSFDPDDKDLIYLQSHGYNLQTEIC